MNPNNDACRFFYAKGMQSESEVDWLWQKLKEQKPQSSLDIGVGGGVTEALIALQGAMIFVDANGVLENRMT